MQLFQMSMHLFKILDFQVLEGNCSIGYAGGSASISILGLEHEHGSAKGTKGATCGQKWGPDRRQISEKGTYEKTVGESGATWTTKGATYGNRGEMSGEQFGNEWGNSWEMSWEKLGNE